MVVAVEQFGSNNERLSSMLSSCSAIVFMVFLQKSSRLRGFAEFVLSMNVPLKTPTVTSARKMSKLTCMSNCFSMQVSEH